MPYCHRCWRKYEESELYCSHCGSCLKISPEAEKTDDKGPRSTDQSTSAFREIGRFVDANQGFFKSLLVLFVALIILYGLSISNAPKTEPRQDTGAKSEDYEKQRLMDELYSHQKIIEEDFRKIEGLDKGLPQKTSEAQDIQYAEAVIYMAQLTKQHVVEYKDFVRRHESEFLKMGMSPAELLTKYDREMLILDDYLKRIEQGLQQMRSNREAVAHLLKLLASLLVSSG